ncbi:hypothetical protein OHT52_00170 [Streptomyces sp. NBC_00247]|uniref:hypothetical protein n=1 Tax=Streptomyces sp. NBC_00247 TaxID=2975689 RepID=UPI002E2B8D16|nr:hypothetical protein [Streptomyces sp. NBC_00247]
MVSVRGSFEYADGLTPGQSKDGGLHHNLYDEEMHLVGHATFVPDDPHHQEYSFTDPLSPCAHECHCGAQPEEPERLDVEEVLALLVMLVTFVQWSAPRLKRWWDGQARPFVESTRGKFARTPKSDNKDETAEPLVPTGSDSWETSGEGDTGRGEDRVSMDSEWGSARRGAALMRRLFSEEQLRVLRGERIEESDSSSESGALVRRTPQQIRDDVRLMLEENPSLLTKESQFELMRILARVRAVPGLRSIERRRYRGR